MLGKLLKYEWKATARYFVFLYAAVLGMALLNKFFWFIESENVVLNVLRGIITAVFVLLIIASFVFSFVIIIYRFYKNLLSDEGYLSFTLPVSVSKHIISKMLIGALWSFLTVIVLILALLILAINTGFLF
jgi:hypothetical protein